MFERACFGFNGVGTPSFKKNGIRKKEIQRDLFLVA